METSEVEQVIDEEESQDGEINVIPVQLVESYEGGLESVANSSNIIRGKYYKQTYRPAWEEMPDFKGWLRGVEGQPTRAYCIYCSKTLHAHRLSLLKHTCTLRHQKAAQIFTARKNKITIMDHQEMQTVPLKEDESGQEDVEGEEETIVEYSMASIEETEQEVEEEEEDSDGLKMDQQFVQNHLSHIPKPPISTTVIDNTRGTPISGLQVSLYKLIDGRWTYINEGLTNTAGKFSEFMDRVDFTPGRYKLHFDVDRYFEARKIDSLFPFIEVVFDSTLYSDHYHIPLLLSPFGYTTYRG